ncbi:MAG: Na+/H+ antiporter NhaA, partial [Bacteroidota bacterium]
LSDPRKAMLPVAAAIGGMVVPALIYLFFNVVGPGNAGWGIPMATDIAFALGVLHLLGNRIPISLKVFLTALAVADDIGAVLVIAFFYTSEINLMSLGIAGLILAFMITANRLGIRNTTFYAVFSICGLWLSFLISGVHPTIAAVLAAFTIPANVKLPESDYLAKLERLMSRFRAALPNGKPTVSEEQLHILEDIRTATKHALTPLQRLEHMLHPLVALLIMPIFALCNAGFVIGDGFWSGLLHPVSIGAFLGLVVGKFIGVAGVVVLLHKMGWSPLPTGMGYRHVVGAGLLAGIGFTMSLFVAGLAFPDGTMMENAKLGIISASVVAGITGYLILRRKPTTEKDG